MPLNKATWKPRWQLQKRAPDFLPWLGNLLPSPIYEENQGGRKRFWANLPAFDILQLHRNEGGTHAEDLKIMFAGTCQ